MQESPADSLIRQWCQKRMYRIIRRRNEMEEYPERVWIADNGCQNGGLLLYRNERDKDNNAIEYIRADSVEDEVEYKENIDNWIMEIISTTNLNQEKKFIMNRLARKTFETYHLIRKEK